MLKFNKNAFTLIELLVVITILAVISVVAYTNFSWSTDKAKNSKKTADLTSIETALQTFFQAKNYYPMPTQYDANKEVWGYNSWAVASISNTLTVTKNWDQITWITAFTWWWMVYLSWSATQIWAKWTFDNSLIWKEYLSQNLVDPSIADIKVWNDKYMKDYWVWKYVYWVYAKNNTIWDSTSLKWSSYNLAITIKDEQKWVITKIIWAFDDKACTDCPKSLIWSWSANNNLLDWESHSWSTFDANTRIPYPISF